jgi:hypothetical protein
MSEYSAATCPLCASPDAFCWIAENAEKYYSCPTCSSFQVTGEIVPLIRVAGPAWRDYWSRQAQMAPPTHRLAISRADGVEFPYPTHGLNVRYFHLSQVNVAAAPSADTEKYRLLP